MKQIEAFVDSVYQNVGGNKKEINELKAEMKSHLLEAVYELKTEGKSEQKAIEIAIERFGGEKEMRSVVGQLFKAQKAFAKWVLYTAIAFLLISTLIFGIVMPIEKSKVNQNNQFASQILNSLGDNEGIPTQLETDIREIVQNSGRITGISIYDHEKLFSSAEGTEPIYSVREGNKFSIWNNIGFLNYIGYGESNNTWHVSIESKSYEGTAIILLLVGIVVYWTLFTIWATINVYHHRRLNIGWVIVFALLNIVGYFTYRLVGNKQLSKVNS
ncbi:permease prefix domain 1-containing protein [Lysinibacillus pakistanensis]|uniref:Permease prefix domain 1-containing protein n=1 Tax=Lysinibacillus pakistanensis TaxID=759811 RepID=A0AAX3WSK2_9BACI|nr:permease prefix domain 1-containing protein [Lysinibacillus pakistanensis]MDM5233710.1 permease prefix domain 1-containing protein [Lysinibacillus pakistanensis]WHY44335.1 permease prefix domain 1-containing protein [Lysinibacillus pakistanensis]WHY49342.1 permease prefix domain 1-containing protein [Lysinibacillus pakistanensis]